MATPKKPVLVVGAGPTGLLCSIWLTRFGVSHRIIDKLPSTGLASRAMGVHARTLEIYRSLGIAQTILDLGHPFTSYSFFYHGDLLYHVPIGQAGVGLSPYPIVLSVTQDEHEKALEKHLKSLGTTVQRNVELVSMDLPASENDPDDIRVVLRDKAGKEEVVEASYVVGCDGARSPVRAATGITMEGGTYPRAFYVADVICSGDMPTSGRMNLFITRDEYACFLPLPYREGRARIIGLVPTSMNDKTDITFDDLRPLIKIAAPALEVGKVEWFATYKNHHRCAAHFQYANRVFLCGDAAHLHSPVGAQGMNTGLGDATNIAWKLATVWHGAASKNLNTKALLDSYEAERRPFALELVNTTDTFFRHFTDDGWMGHIVRNYIVYYVLPIANRFVNMGKHMFKLESQVAIAYPKSSLSQSAGTISKLPGKRLPWLEEVVESTEKLNKRGHEALENDNHAVIDGAGWQAHLFPVNGTLVQQKPWLEKVQAIAQRYNVAMKIFAWDNHAKKAGFAADEIYLVRPDGYIGLAIGLNVANLGKILDDYLGQYGSDFLSVKPSL